MFRKLNLRTALVSFIFVIILTLTAFSQNYINFNTIRSSAQGITLGNYELLCKLDTTQVVSGQLFSITITCIDQLTQQPVNPVEPVNITIIAGDSSKGILSGNTMGTIPTNDNKVTISGIIYTNNSGEANVRLIISATGIPDFILTTNFLAPEPLIQDSDITIDFPIFNNKNGSSSLISMDIFWTKGDGSKRLVVMKEFDPIPNYEFPKDGTGYSASSVFGTPGTEIGGGYVIYNGNVDTANVKLKNFSNYWVRIFGYNGDSVLSNYNTKATQGNQTWIYVGVDDNNMVTGFNFTNISPNPAIKDINFTLNVNTPSLYTIDVIDLHGCVVAKHCNKKFYDIGNYPVIIPIENLSSGYYILKIYNGTDFAFQVFTIVR